MNFMDFKGPGFTMKVPTDWYITSSPQFQVMFVAPPTKSSMRANLMVTLRPVDEKVTLQDVARMAGETQSKDYPEYELLGEGSVSKGSIEGFERQYRWKNEDKKVYVIQRQVMWLLNQTLVMITTTRTDGEDAKVYDPAFDEMVQTFQFSGS